MYTFHYYGMYRENQRNDVFLAADVCNEHGIPLMHSEVHKLGGEAERETEMDVCEDLLAHFVDCQAAGVANYVWWSYKGDSSLECTPYDYANTCDGRELGSIIMFWLTRASIHADLLLVDDHDGRENALNSVISAAWRVPGQPTIRLLVTNNDAGAGAGYDSGGYDAYKERPADGDCADYDYTFALGYGRLDGAVKAFQYVTTVLVDDKEDIAQVEFDAALGGDGASFTAAIPCYSFTVFEFDVADDAAPPSASTTFAADAAAYVDSADPYAALSPYDNDFGYTVDRADVVAFARFDHVPDGATVVKATLRVVAQTAVDRLVVATTAEPWAAAEDDGATETLTHATAPAFHEESAATLDTAYARDAGAVVDFDVTLAFSDARDSSSVTFVVFGHGSDSATHLAAEWGPGCAFAYLSLESYGGDDVDDVASEVILYDEADVEAPSYAGCAAATPVPTISPDCFVGGQDESCDTVCEANGLECNDDYLAATAGLFQTHNMAVSVQSFGASCDVMEDPVTWKSAPLIKKGTCYPVGVDKTDDRYKCDKVTTTTDAFRVCCCGTVVTGAPTTEDSQ